VLSLFSVLVLLSSNVLFIILSTSLIGSICALFLGLDYFVDSGCFKYTVSAITFSPSNIENVGWIGLAGAGALFLTGLMLQSRNYKINKKSG
jgi:hypothetical protein